MDTTHPPQFRGRPFMPGGGFEHHGGGGSTLDWVIFALQLLMLAALATLIARSFMERRGGGRTFTKFVGPPGGPGRGPNGLEVARIRYAHGDLSRDEYLQIVRDLDGEADAATGEMPTPAGP